jgi:PHD/YefM family antitoxin component YafN of YafNO toxin-antitoxin module
VQIQAKKSNNEAKPINQGTSLMANLKERYLTDEQGKRVAVVLDIQEYEQLLEALEELEAIQAYDAAKAGSHEVVTLAEAIAEIEQFG